MKMGGSMLHVNIWTRGPIIRLLEGGDRERLRQTSGSQYQCRILRTDPEFQFSVYTFY